MKHKILIYGAGGYMGKLFTQYARGQELPIILGSKDPFDTKEALRVFALDDSAVIAQQLHDIKLLINLAGPLPQYLPLARERLRRDAYCHEQHTHAKQ